MKSVNSETGFGERTLPLRISFVKYQNIYLDKVLSNMDNTFHASRLVHLVYPTRRSGKILLNQCQYRPCRCSSYFELYASNQSKSKRWKTFLAVINEHKFYHRKPCMF